jgi:transposase InsO family protein
MVTCFLGFIVEQDGVCKGCALSKQAKATFPNSETRSKGALDLVHSDIVGPMSVESISGCSYFVTFIDGYSKRTWIYFLKAKDEVFSRFQEFKALVEKQTGKKIKVLRLDNGGKYTSNEFKDFCRVVGIKKELTIRYNSQQNEVAERKNKTISRSSQGHDP